MLILRRRPTGYTVDYAQSPEAPEIKRLFHTTEIPTPYTPQADPQTVLADLRPRNTEAIVFYFK